MFEVIILWLVVLSVAHYGVGHCVDTVFEFFGSTVYYTKVSIFALLLVKLLSSNDQPAFEEHMFHERN